MHQQDRSEYSNGVVSHYEVLSRIYSRPPCCLPIEEIRYIDLFVLFLLYQRHHMRPLGQHFVELVALVYHRHWKRVRVYLT